MEDELEIKPIKTRKLGRISMNVAAMLINRRLKEVLPFMEQKIELRTHPELVEAMIGHDYVPIDQSIQEMA